MPHKFKAFAAITVLAASCPASAVLAIPTTVDICYVYKFGACKNAHSSTREAMLAGGGVPTDLRGQAAQVCKVDPKNFPLVKLVTQDKHGPDTDKDKFYHYFKFTCEKG